MKALRLHGIGALKIHDEPIPKADVGEALLRITSVGLCGSDLHWFSEGEIGDAALSKPLVLGHEFAGIVVDGDMDGQRVAVDPAVPCEACEFCQEGNPNLCPNHYFAGQAPDDGALQEYLPWPRKNLFPIPDSFTYEDGVMLEPLGVAIHTVDLGKVKPGMTVGVYGCGPIGLLTIQMARLAGASQIIATDIIPERLDAAKALGASDICLALEGQDIASIMAATSQRGVDVAFEAAGENEAVETAIETCKPGGRVILCGIPSADITSFKASTARRKGLTIKLVRRMKHTYPRAIRLVENGQVDLRSLVTHRFALAEFEEAFEVAKNRQGLKVVINISE